MSQDDNEDEIAAAAVVVVVIAPPAVDVDDDVKGDNKDDKATRGGRLVSKSNEEFFCVDCSITVAAAARIGDE